MGMFNSTSIFSMPKEVSKIKKIKKIRMKSEKKKQGIHVMAKILITKKDWSSANLSMMWNVYFEIE